MYLGLLERLRNWTVVSIERPCHFIIAVCHTSELNDEVSVDSLIVDLLFER